MENRTKLEVYRITMICDQCKIGEMEATGTCLTMYPPIYPHKCGHCNNQKNYNEVYPYREYVEVNTTTA